MEPRSLTALPDADAPPILIVPGLDNSGPGHWQTYWERTLPNAERVEQDDWAQPALRKWTGRLADAVRRHPGAILVAHSLGCPLVAHLAALPTHGEVRGALLVAPADVDFNGPAGARLRAFGPVPRAPLPFPSILVGSRNDPYMTLHEAARLARAWGSRLVDLGEAGHINVASGHGAWLDGLPLLADLIASSRVEAAPAFAYERPSFPAPATEHL